MVNDYCYFLVSFEIISNFAFLLSLKQAEVISDKSSPAVEVNKIGAPMGANIKRPIGSKAAKKQEREERSMASTQFSTVSVMESLSKTQASMAEACGRIASAMDTKNTLNQQFRTNAMKMEVVKMYREMGHEEQAKNILDTIQFPANLPIVPEKSNVPEEPVLQSNVPEEVIFDVDAVE